MGKKLRRIASIILTISKSVKQILSIDRFCLFPVRRTEIGLAQGSALGLIPPKKSSLKDCDIFSLEELQPFRLRFGVGVVTLGGA